MSFDFGKLKSMLSSTLTNAGDGAIVGVDLGSSSVKVVQFHLQDRTPTLDTYGELQLGPYADLEIGQVVRLQQQRLTEALIDIIRESTVTGVNVALSISSASSFTTTLTIDSLDDAEIATRVPVEARKYIPVSLSEVTLDWFPLRQDVEKKQTTLLLVAIYNEALQQLRSVMSAAGLSVSFTELEPFGAIRSSISPEDMSVALIDLGATSTKLYIVNGGVLQKTHNLHPAGQDLTMLLKRNLNIDFAGAETLKRTVGILDDGVHTEAIIEVKEALGRGARELDKVIDTYELQSGTAVPKVLLIGGGATMPGLIPYFQDILQRQVLLAEPFSKAAFPAFLEDTLKEAGPAFSVAVGTALRSFGS